jgi:transcriptional regulator with XRE-family HTH domain
MGAPIYFPYRPATLLGMSAIGIRIRALRKTNVKLNQTELATQVGVDQSVISDIENGAGFGAPVLIGLADALQTTPHYIMRGGTDEMAREANLLGLYRACSESDKRLLLETAGAFADRSRRVEARPASINPQPKGKNVTQKRKA